MLASGGQVTRQCRVGERDLSGEEKGTCREGERRDACEGREVGLAKRGEGSFPGEEEGLERGCMRDS